MPRLQPEAYLIFTASVLAEPRPNEHQKFKKKTRSGTGRTSCYTLKPSTVCGHGCAVLRLCFRRQTLLVEVSHTLCSLPRLRVSSNDAHFSSSSEESQQPQPSFAEFITSERVKVVSTLALALALCNANRVVMSVAIGGVFARTGFS